MRHPLKDVIIVCALIVLCLAVFVQTFTFGYIALDDGLYLARNPHISGEWSWQDVKWALTDVVVSNWHPVTMLSHMGAAASFGREPGPHHAVNVAIHLLNVALLYSVLLRLTCERWPSFVVTAMFAVHPLRVESVAWIAERKGLLCALFGLLAMLAYERYARRPSALKMGAVTVFFLLGLMSKPALVALPFLLLLLDVWPLERFRDLDQRRSRTVLRLVAEKSPLFVAAAAFSVTTYLVQERTGAVSGDDFSIPIRVANAMDSYFKYLVQTVAPIHLAPQYVHPRSAVFSPELIVAAVVIIAITAGATVLAKRRPWLLVGWLWFLGMLVPAIGLIQVGSQARADRYTYLPQIGILILIAWGLQEIRTRFPRAKRPISVMVVAAAAGLAILSWIQTARWKDNFTLFTYTVAIAPESSQAHFGLGVAELERGDMPSAKASFQQAIQHAPPALPEAYSNLAAIELRERDFSSAAQHFGQAVALKPDDADLQVNYGIALLNLGRIPEARAAAEAALRLAPRHPRAQALLQEIQRASR